MHRYCKAAQLHATRFVRLMHSFTHTYVPSDSIFICCDVVDTQWTHDATMDVRRTHAQWLFGHNAARHDNLHKFFTCTAYFNFKIII